MNTPIRIGGSLAHHVRIAKLLLRGPCCGLTSGRTPSSAKKEGKQMPDLGPVELLFVEFPGNQFSGEVAPALQELVEAGTIRVIDLVFVAKDADGNIVGIELEDLQEDARGAFNPLVEELAGLISDEDVEDLGEALEPNSSAAILLFENVWATKFRDALVNSGGQLLARIPIPQYAIDEVSAAIDASN
jgi:uncharacterized membrane protein